MLSKFLIVLFMCTTVGCANAETMGEPEVDRQQQQESVKNDAYQSYLLDTQSLINQKFPDFFSKIDQEKQLKWIDYVGKQGAKYGYENVSLRQNFTLIACYLGKDFMTDDAVDKNIKRFLQDERFSKYVRVRDMQRYLARKNYPLTEIN